MRIFFVLYLMLCTSVCKAMEPEESNKHVYQTQRGDLHFIMEPLDISGVLAWGAFADHQIETLKEDAYTSKNRNTVDALQQFQKHINSASTGTRAWVAYVSNIRHEKVKKLYYATEGSEWEEHVEMCVAVACSSDLNVPFYVPNGIFRNPFYKGELHPNLSVSLHSFIANNMKQEVNDTSLRYAIIKPLSSMRMILRRNLSADSYQDQQEGSMSWIEEIEGKIIGENLSRREICELKEKGRRLIVKNEEGQPIFEINEKNRLSYKWFLGIEAKLFVVKIESLANLFK